MCWLFDMEILHVRRLFFFSSYRNRIFCQKRAFYDVDLVVGRGQIESIIKLNAINNWQKSTKIISIICGLSVCAELLCFFVCPVSQGKTLSWHSFSFSFFSCTVNNCTSNLTYIRLFITLCFVSSVWFLFALWNSPSVRIARDIIVIAKGLSQQANQPRGSLIMCALCVINTRPTLTEQLLAYSCRRYIHTCHYEARNCVAYSKQQIKKNMDEVWEFLMFTDWSTVRNHRHGSLFVILVTHSAKAEIWNWPKHEY